MGVSGSWNGRVPGVSRAESGGGSDGCELRGRSAPVGGVVAASHPRPVALPVTSRSRAAVESSVRPVGHRAEGVPVVLIDRKQETSSDLREDEGRDGGGDAAPAARRGVRGGGAAPPEAGAETFGQCLRRLRTERGLSLADLSARAHYSRSHLSKVENGQKAPTPALADSCDRALRAGGALARLAPEGTGSGTGEVCPYPGLASFESGQARWFFGRDRATASLVARVGERISGSGGPVVVVGPSGAGKSSLVHAGLLPAVARGALPVPGSASWPALSLTPTARPLRELARGLAEVTGLSRDETVRAAASGPEALRSLVLGALRERAAVPRQGAGRGGAGRMTPGLVVVADQFEEIFTLCTDEQERRAFVRALHVLARPEGRERPETEAGRGAGGGAAPAGQGGSSAGGAPPVPPGPRAVVIVVVLGVRADFYGPCLSFPELVAALRDGQFPLGPMTRAELGEAIARPARETGLELEAGLVELLLNDLGARHEDAQDRRAGTLPLLSHALWTTWQHRDKGRMTVAGYQLTDGIRGAVAASAERVYGRLDPAGRAACRQVLLSLVRVGEEEQDTRRRVSRERLLSSAADAGAAAGVLSAFADARLVTMNADSVEITHEALLSAWPRLRDWIDTDRAGLRQRQRLVEAAEAWEAGGGDTALLYRGTQLATAVEWMAGHRFDPETLECRFLQAGVQRERAEAEARRRHTRRLRQLVVLLSVLVLLAGGSTGLALRLRADALTQSERTAAQVAVDEAGRLRQVDPSLAMRVSLAAYRLARTPHTRGALLASSGSVFSTRLPGHRYTVRQAAFTGSVLATAGEDGVTRLSDLRAPTRPVAVEALRNADAVHAVAFSRDGRLMVTGGADAAVTVWSLSGPEGRQRLRQLAALPIGGEVRAAAVTPDGRTLAAATGDTLRLWDLSDPTRPVPARAPRGRGHAGVVNSAAFSHDGRTLATAGDDHTVRLWDVTRRTRPRLADVVSAHAAQVRGVAFSPDDRLLASVSFDRTLRLTDVSDPYHAGRPRVLDGHIGLVHSVAFRQDGRRLATGGDDQTARLWDVPTRREVATLPQPNPVRAVGFSPDGSLVTGDDEGRVLLWHLPPPVAAGHTGPVNSVAYTRAGRMLVTAGDDRTVRLWDAARPGSGAAVASVPHPAAVNAAEPSADGRLLVTAGADHKARLFDLTDPRHPRLLAVLTGHREAVYTAAVSPDKRLVATGGEDHDARLWNITDPRRPVPLTVLTEHHDRINSLALSKDGRLLVTAGGDYRARVWDLTDRHHPALIATFLHPNQVNDVAPSPDGRLLATTDDDRKTRLWSIPRRHRPGVRSGHSDITTPVSVLAGHREASRGVAIAPDGHTLAAVSDDRTVQLWDIRTPRRPALLTALTGHTDQVRDVTFTPDGRTLTTAGADGAIRWWSNDAAGVARRICALDGPGLDRDEWAVHFPGHDFRPSCGGRTRR
ncbi:helix-turn-helix domain-containing protein [Streptomyces sp. NPDC006624]|uniref:nSTAND1 domain-containing NTPase n=1 Tax=Streptomyces sp. NPDC006624 TaxID=3154892 RepID=UPI0033B34076